jgi:hypothetical protein
MKSNIIKTLALTTLMACTPVSNNKNVQKNALIEKDTQNIENIINLENTHKLPFENAKEYDIFIRSVVNENYIADVKEIYDFYNIKREIPKYGFKQNYVEFTYFTCMGAGYFPRVDSIYFYSICSEEMLQKYKDYLEKSYKADSEKNLTEKIHYYIKHEAAHAFYNDLGKKLGADYLFEDFPENPSIAYDLKHKLIEEGVAEYISRKGELTKEAINLKEKDSEEIVHKIVTEGKDALIYQLGSLLVKPILDKNFDKGIEELIKNPLTLEDCNDLKGYQEKILKNISK